MNQVTIESNNDVLLVVDGDPIALSVKTLLLKRHGYGVIEAETGADALAIAAAKRPALILLDSALKDVDGFDVCRRLKAQSETQFIKVLQTSHTHIGAQEYVREQAVGADAYLVEPAEEGEVLATVRVLLKLAEQEHKNRRLIERLSLLEPSQVSQGARYITVSKPAEVGVKEGQAHLASASEAVGVEVDEEQRRLADIVENSADAIIGKDLQGIITSWNHGAEALLGYTEREMLGRPVTLLFPPDRVEEERVILDRLKAGEFIRHYETVRRRKDGREICVSLTISPIRDQRGVISGASKIMRDITDRKQAEAALHESEKRLRLFIEHAPAGLAMFDRDMRYLAATRRWITDYHLPREVEGHSHYEYFPSLPDKWMEAHRRGLAGEVLRVKADPFVGRDGTTQWITWEIRPWYRAPGIVGGILIGADDVTTEVMAQQALRESEARLQAIMDRAPAAIFVRDRDGRSLFMNEACARVMGFDHTQVQGKTEYELYPLELAEQFRRNDQVVWKTGQAHVFEEYVPQSDGLHTYVSNKFLLCDTEGSPYALCGIASDITSRRRMEDALRESEERLRLALEGADLGSWDVVLSTGNAMWNRRHALMQGYAPDDQPYTLAQWQDRIHPEDLGRVLAVINEARQSHASFAVEHRVCLPQTSTVRWVSLYGRFSYDESGKPVRLSGVSMDITERKHSEDALRQAELRFQSMAHIAPVLIWQTDSTGVIFFNQHYLQFFGETFEGVKAMGWAQYLHPEDKGGYLAAYQAAFESQAPYEFKCRFRRYDGQYRWFKTAGMPLYGPDETFHGFVGCSVDITDIMLAEQALRESEERFRQLSTSLPLLAWTCSPDGSCDFLSQQWVAYTGIPESPQWESGWLDQLHPDDRPRTMEAWNAAVQGTADDFHVEFRLRRYDGVYRWFDTKAIRARDDDGRTVKWYGFNTDITERKLAEEGLREAHERLQHWNVELELAVQEKTRELQQSQDHLRAMATELNLAEQRERKRLATDLHDHLQQMLVAGKIMIGQGRRAAEDITVYETVLKKVDDILTDALTYSRTLVAELSPPVLRDHGLSASLKWLGDYMLKYHDHTVTVIVPEDEEYKLPDNHVILLFQSTRELLINSAKHAGTGQATLLMEEQEDRLCIILKDDGKGFDAAAAGKPYGGSSAKFGLFSIKERMRALGGSLIIESAPGQGTTAILALPLAKNSEGREEKTGEEDGMDQQMSDERSTAHPGLSSGAIRVMLVDDHAMVRQGLHSMLDAYMDIHVVGEAKDGAEAIKSVEELLPQVVVMDINMPKMNGIEATKQITRLHPDIIVIGISVNIGDDNSDAMQRAGAVTLLTKEAAVEQLYNTIQDAVKTRRIPGRL